MRHLKKVEKSVKNKFRWQWLEMTVEIMLKGERKSIPLIDWIRKIDVPGKAKYISILYVTKSLVMVLGDEYL